MAEEVQYSHPSDIPGLTLICSSKMRNANAMAAKLAAGIVARGYVLDAETATNQVFPILPNSVISALKAYFAFYVWAKSDNDRSVIRLVTSWATDERQIDAFLARLDQA